jgi:hypothetical protein
VSGADLSLTLSPESIEAIAEKVAELVAERQRLEQGNGLGTAGLISLNELVAELPKTKGEATWRRWLYEHVRRPDEVTAMGATKLGGSWHFDRAKVSEWLATRY